MASVYKKGRDRGRKDSKWRVSWFDAEAREWRQKTGYTDKRASLEMGTRLERDSALRAEGLVDPMDEHRRRGIYQHLDDFIAVLRTRNRDGRYVLQQENRIRRIIDGTGTGRLHELDPVQVVRFLSGMRKDSTKKKDQSVSGATRNEYIVSIKSFTRWAVEARRVEHDPLASLRRLERKAIRSAHPRRALTWSELGRLLAATQRRPLLEMLTVRTGKQRGQQVARVSEGMKSKAERLGRERRLGYLVAIWAGLRRNEIRLLTWGDVDLECLPPRIRLRADTTKSKRADNLVIHPQLADAFRAARPKDCQGDTPVLRTVPGMKVLKADLRLAGIEYGDQATGFADLHATRVSLNTKMASEGINLRVRQAHMRHTDPRLTSITYTDESLLPVADAVLSLPSIPGPESPEPTVLTLPTGVPAGAPVRNLSQYCHKETPPACPDGSGHGVTGGRDTGTDGRR